MRGVFWNVDTQYDFMRDDDSFKGALAVPEAREIEGNLALLTQFAKQNGIYVVNTVDWHRMTDEEISTDPNFVTTYPPHCMEGTKGAEYVPATNPENAYRLTRDATGIDFQKLQNTRNLVIEKYEFDVFAGNPLAEEAINALAPRSVVVYGVALNVCDDFAIMGNVNQGRDVYAVIDAMKDLPHLVGTPLDTDKVLQKWKDAGVKFVKTKDVLENRV